jgi:hypothetical protein
MEQRKHSRISRLMQKKEQNKKNETEKRLPCGSLLGSIGVVLGILVPPLGGRCGCVGRGVWGEPVGRLMRKRKHVKRTPGSGGQKNGAEKKIPGSGGCCGKNNFRIRRTKEWSREKFPGSGKSEKKNVTEKRFQDQAVRIRQHMKRRKMVDWCPVISCWAVWGWLLGCSGCPLGGGAGVWWGWVFGRKPGGHHSLNAKKRRKKRTPGSGGQKNGVEKRFQDQAV